MSRYADHEIEQALRTVAALIANVGEVYWPILEKLEDELNRRRARSAQLVSWLGDSDAGSHSGHMQDRIDLPVPMLKAATPLGNRLSGLQRISRAPPANEHAGATPT